MSTSHLSLFVSKNVIFLFKTGFFFELSNISLNFHHIHLKVLSTKNYNNLVKILN